MNWLNLHTSTLDSEEFLGSDPVERGTWLCLQRYCIGQENGGVIADCAGWSDRKWQQLVRITKKEATRETALWSWDGDTLILWGYPNDKEIEVKTNRANGSKGGRPKSRIAKQNHPVSDGLTSRFKIAETERKGKEIEGEGEGEGEGNCEVSPPPLDFPEVKPDSPHRRATFPQILAFGTGQMPPISEECCEAFFDRMEADGWINNFGHPLNDWRARFRTWATAWAKNEAGKGGAR